MPSTISATTAVQRDELAALRRYAPRFTKERILAECWEEALRRARRLAEDDMDCPLTVQTLTWEEVFEETYDERLAGQ